MLLCLSSSLSQANMEQCLGGDKPAALPERSLVRFFERVIEDLQNLSEALGKEAHGIPDPKFSAIDQLKKMDEIIAKKSNEVSNQELRKTVLTETELKFILAHLPRQDVYLREAVEKGEATFKDVEKYFLNNLKRLNFRIEVEAAAQQIHLLRQKGLIPTDLQDSAFLNFLEDALIQYNNIQGAFTSGERQAIFNSYQVFTPAQVIALNAAFREEESARENILEHADFPSHISQRILRAFLAPEFRNGSYCCLNSCENCPNNRGLRNWYDPKFKKPESE